MSKYRALQTFLKGQHSEQVPMTFAEIEEVIGFKLPKSKVYPAWWSNNPTNNVMTNEWLAAGYKTEQVDIEVGKLVFRKTEPVATGFAEAPKVSPKSQAKQGKHPLFGWMKGTFTIAPGTDLTAPADPEWADLVDDPNWGKLPE